MMKRKILALAFVAALVFGFSPTAEGGSGGGCETVSVACPDGTVGDGFTGIVCNGFDFYYLLNYYCTEADADD